MVTRAFVLVLLAGCLQSGLVPCGDKDCPSNRVCVANACVDPERVTACAGIPDGDSCTFGGSDGVCANGVCNAALCGDGEIVQPEQCDGEDLNGATCLTYGFYEPDGLACRADCQADTSSCVGRCGDTVRNGPELCDTTVGANISTCFEVGFDYGSITCSSALCAPIYDACVRVGWLQYSHSMDFATVYATPRPGDTYFADGAGMTRITDAATEDITLPAACYPRAIWASQGPAVFTASTTQVCRYDGTNVVEWPVSGTSALWGASPTDVYAAGTTMQHFDGQTWSVVDTGATAAFTGIFGRGSTIAATTTNGVAIYRGGAWSHVAAPAANPSSPWVSTSGVVYVFANAKIYRRDAASWALVSTFGVTAFWGVGETLYAYGNGSMRALVGSAWLEIDTPLAITGFSAIGGGPDHLLMVAIYNAFFESRGFAWTPPETMSVNTIWGFSPSNIVVLGGTNAASRFDGTAWSSFPPTPLPTVSVWGHGTNQLIAISSQDAFHFNGSAWSTKPIANVTNLNTIWGESPTRVFATGTANAQQEGHIYGFDGSNWSQVFSVPGGAGDGWGSATAGSYALLGNVLYHLAPGAPVTQWTPITLPDSTGAVGIFGSDDELVITFQSRRAYRRTQGMWAQLPTRLGAPPTELTGVAGDAFGNTGNDLYHYDGATFDRVRVPDSVDGAVNAVFASKEIVVVGSFTSLVMLVRPQ